jgi:SAM-dependent methyltransferase
MPNIKYSIKKLLRWLDYHIGVRAWLSSEPNQNMEDVDFLRGTRELEYGWVAANVPAASGSAVDVGCVNSPISSIMTMLGYRVIGVDMRDDIPYRLDGFSMIQGDFNQVDLPFESFDVVVLCSTVEHIGLAGRYDNLHLPDGDLMAMSKVQNILKPTGICILTIPVGLDDVYVPWHRIYGIKRLPQLLQGFRVLKSQYFVKNSWDKWHESNGEEALSFAGSGSRYALGVFVLSRDDSLKADKL